MEILKNYINGEWVESESKKLMKVNNPATGETMGKVPFSTQEEVKKAITKAKKAFPKWRETPIVERARYLFDLKQKMEDNFEELASLLTKEEGKNIDSARGEIRRTIENVETAAGMPSLMMGYNNEDVARNIDESLTRQPLGVFAGLAPYNFPAMVPFWFIPYAIASGNTYIVKPSEKVPFSQKKLIEFLDEVGLPSGVINLVNGGKEVADILIESEDVEGVSFVGSTDIAKKVYKKAAQEGKRVQAQGGACNFLAVMPDAKIDKAISNIVNSFYACARQRCLAGQNLIAVGNVYEELKNAVVEAVSNMKVGYGLEEDVDMGPVITPKHKESILQKVNEAEEKGAEILVDGRDIEIEEYPDGNFIGPTVLTGDIKDMDIVNEEIFGPVMNIIRVDNFDEVIDLINSNNYGNMASIYTQNGKWAREFKYRVNAGNIGVNLGVAAPMPFYPFSGYKDSFFGDLHAQGKDVVNFFTEHKIVIKRWL